MKNTNKAFLKTAIILTGALAVICVFMPEGGAAQIIIVILVAMLAGLQWFLHFYLNKK